jgi:hypothetical protein
MKLIRIVFVVILLVAPCFVMHTFAQLPPTTSVPLDGGVSGFLIAAGLYGARKVYKARKK